MTKQEFIDRSRNSRRAGDRRVRILLPIMLSVTVVGLWMVCDPILDHYLNFKENAAAGQAYVLSGAILCGTLLVALFVLGCQRGVKCPHCRNDLFGVAGKISVATSNCPYCGEKAFE